jgi:tRNA A-37 threonylcarbamoyl transferase component Bud32
VEHNLVFELNGQVVRKAGELLSSLHSAYMIEKDMESPTQNYFPRGINEFLVDLATGRGDIPPIAAAPERR